MKIALDAMGGDYAPKAVIQGALDAISQDHSIELILVGNENEIKSFLPSSTSDRIRIIHSTQVVNMEDKGSRVFKEKPDSSLVKGMYLLRENNADAFISAGHTGAMLSTATLVLGRIAGAGRPAVGAYIPSNTGGKIICDVGANPDAKPKHLVQFAVMASLYLDHIENVKAPKIGLINIGSEPGKGSELYKEAYDVLKKEFPSFIGNVESRYIFVSEADVLICDGFVGNTLIKFAEGWITYFSHLIKEKINDKLSYKLGAKLLYPVLHDINNQYDYEEHGGSPLLGVNGVCIIAHGSSSSRAIKNSILLAKKCVEKKLVEDIKEGLIEHMGSIQNESSN